MLALSLIFIEPLSPMCIVIFLIAGFSDMIDGPIARRIENASSELGAELDSIADMLLVIVTVVFVLPHFDLWSWLMVCFYAALGFKLASAIPGLIKHRKVFFLHTLSNKLLALILFIGAILYFIFGGVTFVNAYFLFMIVSVFIITTEEMVVISMLDYPNKNIRGFWEVKRINEEYRNAAAE